MKIIRNALILFILCLQHESTCSSAPLIEALTSNPCNLEVLLPLIQESELPNRIYGHLKYSALHALLRGVNHSRLPFFPQTVLLLLLQKGYSPYLPYSMGDCAPTSFIEEADKHPLRSEILETIEAWKASLQLKAAAPDTNDVSTQAGTVCVKKFR